VERIDRTGPGRMYRRMRVTAPALIGFAALAVIGASGARANPSHCEASGVHQKVGVRAAAAAPIAGAKIIVDYPEAKVALPGSRDDASVKARVLEIPSAFDSLPNDLDHAVRIVLASGTTTLPERAFTLEFDLCKGATPLHASDFTCSIEQAAGVGGEPLENARCSTELR